MVYDSCVSVAAMYLIFLVERKVGVIRLLMVIVTSKNVEFLKHALKLLWQHLLIILASR